VGNNSFRGKNPQKIDKTLTSVFFFDFFLFYRVFGCFSAMGVQRHYKNILPKNSVEKKLHVYFTKERQKIQNRFFLDFFYHVFRRFSVRVFKNTTKQYQKGNLALVLLWPLTYLPTYPRGSPIFFAGPLPGPAAVPRGGVDAVTEPQGVPWKKE
jgi:hypothetical protein